MEPMSRNRLQLEIMLLENKQRKLQGDLNEPQLRAGTLIELKQISMKIKEYRSMFRIMDKAPDPLSGY
jgi:hypothetical protein